MVKDRGDWHAAVYGITESWTRLSDGTTTTKVYLAMQRQFWLSQRWGATGIQKIKTRHADTQPAMHKTAPKQRTIPPKMSRVQVPRLRNSALYSNIVRPI